MEENNYSLGDANLDELKDASAPLMKYLADKGNPHFTAVVTNTKVILMKGEMMISTMEYVKD